MIGRAGLWLAAVGLLALTLAVLAAGGRLQIHSNLLALLPAPQRDPVIAAAMERIGEMGQRRLLILIGTGSAQRNMRAADAAARALARSEAFVKVAQGTDDLLGGAQRRQTRMLHFEHRFHLLAPADRAALARLAKPPAGDDAAALRHFIGRAKARLYGIGMGAGTSRFIQDPLGLSAAYRRSRMAGLALPGLRLGRDGHFYVTNQQGQRFAVIFARSRLAPFTLDAQTAQLEALDNAREAVHAVAPNATVLVSGVLPHAAAATRQARRDVSVIGAGSLAGIVLLTLWVFGSIRPFLQSFTVMAGGCLLALVATTVLFGGIHVITLVFGASIVGVAVDYCMHFFCQRFDTPAPKRAIRCILPAITLGLMANVLAYGSMAVAHFPGLRQMGLFAVFGLIGAWLGVILLLPARAGPPPRRGRALRLARYWLEHGPARIDACRSRVLWGMAAMLAVLLPLTLANLSAPADIGLLYNAPAELKRTDLRVSRLLGTRTAGRTIVVRGDSPAAVLQAEAELVQALGGQTPVANVSAITEAFPTAARQRRNYARLAQTLYAPGGPVQQLLGNAGYSRTRIQAHMRTFAAQKGRILRFEQWLASPASRGLRNLWLGRVGNQWASLVRILRVNNSRKLAQMVARHPRAAIIDRPERISRILGHYRDLAMWLLGGAYLLAFLLLWRPLGARGAVAVILPPMLASVIVAFVFALTGWPFSLFNVLAMILLLGLGSDYGIFLRMADRHNASAMLAVGASAVTNLLAFGLLSLSATPALHAFGLTLALGLALTFIFTSVVGSRASAPRSPVPD